MPPITIVYDHQIFALQYYGGISRYICEIAPRIAVQPEFQVKIMASAYANCHLPSVPRTLVVGFPVAVPPQFLKPIERINRQLFRGYSHWQRPTIVHETYYSAQRLAPKSSRLVLTVYDMIHEKFPQFFRRDDRTRARKLSALQRADHVICISETTKRDLLTFTDVDPSKVSVIYLGCPEYPHLVNLNTHDVQSPQIPYLLYVGPRDGYKNFRALLQSYARSQSLQQAVELVCYGGFPFSPDEIHQMAQLNIPAHRVRWVGGDDRQLARLYRQAVALVYPSLYEGFGIPPLEAMTCYCPVVCSNSSAVQEVVGTAAELFDPTDVDAITHALERVVFSSERRSHLISQGIQQAQQFSWHTCALKTGLVYKALV